MTAAGSDSPDRRQVELRVRFELAPGEIVEDVINDVMDRARDAWWPGDVHIVETIAVEMDPSRPERHQYGPANLDIDRDVPGRYGLVFWQQHNPGERSSYVSVDMSRADVRKLVRVLIRELWGPAKPSGTR